MNLHYQYYWFKEVIPHDTCDKIIQMGNKRIEQVKIILSNESESIDSN